MKYEEIKIRSFSNNFNFLDLNSKYLLSLSSLSFSKLNISVLSMDWLAPCARVGKNPLKAFQYKISFY